MRTWKASKIEKRKKSFTHNKWFGEQQKPTASSDTERAIEIDKISFQYFSFLRGCLLSTYDEILDCGRWCENIVERHEEDKFLRALRPTHPRREQRQHQLFPFIQFILLLPVICSCSTAYWIGIRKKNINYRFLCRRAASCWWEKLFFFVVDTVTGWH